MSENETPPWSPEKGALWRLEQWRDGGECPVGYTAGNVGFAEDVKAVMSVFDDAVRGLTDASRLISIANAEVEALKHDNARLMDSLNGEMRARLEAEGVDPNARPAELTTETSTLRSLASAMDRVREAFEMTENGLLSDHCQNAMRQIRAAMRIAVGDER